MLFQTIPFAIFFVVFFALYYLLPFRQSQRIWFLFIAGVLFYATYSPRFLPYLLGTGLVDYYIAAAIAREDESNERRRTLLLVISMTLNLAVLAYFKYTNFFIDNVNHALGAFGSSTRLRMLHIVLPIGISFYTFQSMSYVLDVYRGSFMPQKKVHEFLASLTFFPHLMAGPIVRASQFLPQMRRPLSLTRGASIRAGFLIVGGLVKKTVADLLAPTTDRIFRDLAPHSTLAAWSGTLSFAAQVYGDFSGYTDIAIGLSLLLGFELPPNFNLPYLASTPIDFWARWHISLSTWLRDYLYLPLAVHMRSRPYLALLITWLLGGLWHGASWNFVLWGGYNGLLLVLTHRAQTRFPVIISETLSLPWRVLRVLATFYLVMIGYAIFRSQTMGSALSLVVSMHVPRVPSNYSYAACLELLLAVAALVFCHAFDIFLKWATTARWRVPVLCLTAIVGLCFVIIFGASDQGFIYFAF